MRPYCRRKLLTLACGVKRREAQRFGGKASQAFRSPPARLGTGLASPSLQGARGVRRNAPAPPGGAVAQRPGASRRSISSSEDKGKWDRPARALGKTGGGALATSHSARE